MSQPKNASPCKLHDRVQRDEFHEREQRQRQTEIRVRELRGVTGEGCGGRPGGAAHGATGAPGAAAAGPGAVSPFSV